ncbi:MAG: rane protein [Nitrosarchaeum sp.]|jgi:hypothetical protein|nr:rane protein [Nitrosarchaeum sp.]
MKTSLTNPKKTLTVVTSIALAVLVLASVGSLYLGNKGVTAQEETAFPSREKTISVTGTATSSAAPDLLVVKFGVEIQNKTAKDALDANSLSMNQIIDAIKSVGIAEDDISTASFNIYPVYEGYEDQITKRWTQELVGYRVTNTVTVETSKLNSAADIIDGAVAAGANRVDSVYFTLSPEKQLQINDELIGEAVQNAQKKAENALVPLNHKIIGVKMVSLSDFGLPPPMPMYEMAYDSMAKSSAPTPIFSSDQDVTTTANVVFIIGSN